MARLSTIFLLTRHILRTMWAHKLRSGIVWAALAAALAVVIGVVSFLQSVDDSHRSRGEAISGIADLQVQAVSRSQFKESLAKDLRGVWGTKLVVPITEQRMAIRSKRSVSTVATAFGIDNQARKLRSSLQRELNVKTPKNPENGGLTISRELAADLGVKRGDKVRVLAYERSPLVKIRRVQDVSPSLSEVVAMPRKTIEGLRGERGPNTLYVQLKDGVSVEQWQKRARDELPDNATVVTSESQQHQLDRVLSTTTRSYTYLFGSVALLIVALLVYVLQLMRMVDRQEDVGLVRALGSTSLPMVASEIMTLCFVLLAALPAGYIGGRAFAHQLAGNLPDYLTQVFNFTMIVEIKPVVVGVAMIATLAVAVLATVGALMTTRAPVAEQLGRSPQSGATAVALISLKAAIGLTALGAALMLLAALLAGRDQFIATAFVVLLAIGTIAPGLAALLTHALTRIESGGGTALMIARSSIESNPRRVAISTAIMALAVCAVVPLQLMDHALDQRTKEMTGIHRESTLRIAASGDLFTTVPVHTELLRKALKEKRKSVPVEQVTPSPGMTPAQVATAQRAAVVRARTKRMRQPLPSHASEFTMDFTTYRDQRIGVMSLDSRRTWPFKRQKGDAPERNSASGLRANRDQVVISKQLAAWTDLEAGDKVRLQTPDGFRSTKIAAVVDDMSWPMGTVYFDTKRYRELYGRGTANSLIVKPGKVDREALENLRPLHTFTGADLAARITSQMDKTRENMLAMRWMIVIAALVALTGILATSVLARRREWAVLRAVGTSSRSLLLALAIELALVLILGATVGAVGGVIAFEGPIVAFLDHQGFTLGREIVLGPLLVTASTAVLAGVAAVMLSAVAVARAKLTDALTYE